MHERRTTAKVIRFRREELARITKRARASGRISAFFIRETALGLVNPSHGSSAKTLLGELAQIGRPLDQLGRPAQ